MTAVIEGEVQGVSVKPRDTQWGKKNATSFLINNDWYSGGFKKYNINKGDKVQLSFETNGNFKNIKTIVVTEKAVAENSSVASNNAGSNSGGTRSMGRTFPVDALAPERAINRQNALTNAVKYTEYAAETYSLEEVIQTARLFEAYTTGDLDREEAEAMLGMDDE